MSEKILITGTGRCGTTFLMLIYIHLNEDTPYKKENYEKYIYKNCNSGLENNYLDNYRILKNPSYLNNILNIFNDSKINLKYFIIPIRNLENSCKSREINGFKAGGFINKCSNYEQQLNNYNYLISNYLYLYVKYSIPTIFIDFDKMIIDSKYLYDKLLPTFTKIITFEEFNEIYIICSNLQKKMIL